MKDFETAVKETLDTKYCNRNEVFIWEERFEICDQFALDVINYDSRLIPANNRPQREKTIDFFDKFAKYYSEDHTKLDELIENQILKAHGISENKYANFEDAKYHPRIIEPRTVKPFNIYKPREVYKPTKLQQVGTNVDIHTPWQTVPKKYGRPTPVEEHEQDTIADRVLKFLGFKK
jgi:hypothetical protein